MLKTHHSFFTLIRHSSQFREKFVSNYAHSGSWYPGHMFKGMLKMQAKLAVVDCVLEVHDARIPFSGRNPKFYSLLTAVRPHILVLNKCDLVDMTLKDKITERIMKQNPNIHKIMFTNCKVSHGGVNEILPQAVELIQNSATFNRAMAPHYSMMAIGIPNVGKSSLINRLRNIHLKKKKASTVGPIPGITKSVLEKIRISENPSVFLYDTPGVAEPKIDSQEVGLRLALCRTLKDDLIGEELIADYLLYWLNKHKNYSYVDFLKLKDATDDLRLLLIQVAKNQNLILKIRNDIGEKLHYPDLLSSARYFITGFREGRYGKIILDIDSIK